MEAIKFIDVVREDWLLISPELKKFLNQTVEIQISPIEGMSKEIESRMITIQPPIYDGVEREKIMNELAGCFDDETAKHFFDAVAECRQIDYEDWK